jgi:hypothetical protein
MGSSGSVHQFELLSGDQARAAANEDPVVVIVCHSCSPFFVFTGLLWPVLLQGLPAVGQKCAPLQANFFERL